MKRAAPPGAWARLLAATRAGGALHLRAIVLLIGLGSTEARAANGVVLPKGQDPAAWAEALALAGLSVSAPGEGAVEILDMGGTWMLRARDGSGRVQEVTVAPPRDARAREDLAWLAKSMLRTTRAGSSWDDVRAPPAPATPAAAAGGSPSPGPAAAAQAQGSSVPSKPKVPPAPKPVVPSPAVVAPTEAPAEPVDPGVPGPPQPMPFAPEPPPAAPPHVWPPAEPAPLAGFPASPDPSGTPGAGLSRLRGRIAAGGGIAWREGTASAPTTSVSATLRFSGPSFGFEARWTPPRALLSEVFEGTLAETDLLLKGGWTFDVPLEPALALAAGASVRGYAAGLPLAVGVVPVVGVEAGVHTPPVGPFVLMPWAVALTDLRGTSIRVDGVPVALLPPVELRAGVSVVAEFSKKD